MYLNRTSLQNHIKAHIHVYVFMTILLLTGIIFGAIIVNSMTFIQKEDLFFQLSRYFGMVHKEGAIEYADILRRSFFFHTKYLLLICLLGLTIIGLPVVWVLIFLKGLVIGFSVGFIVNQLGLKGLIIATLSIAPQNIVIIPVYLIAASLSMLFSLKLIYKLFGQSYSESVGRPILQYIIAFPMLLLYALGGSLIETFVANEAFKAIIKSGLYIIININ